MDIQQILTLGIVALAFAFLGRHVWAKIRAKGGDCGGCGMCGRPAPKTGVVRAAPQATPLVTLGVARADKRGTAEGVNARSHKRSRPR